MKIKRDILNALLLSVPCAPPEMGGILGGKDGTIVVYEIDRGISSSDNYDHYYPNVSHLNNTLQIWQTGGIEFCGIFHSHFPGGENLSAADKRYIQRIMQTMPAEINGLFFPIIISPKIICYQANRCGSEVRIIRDDIKIL